MAILIDTHVLLWYLMEPHRLSEMARKQLQHPQEQVCLSVASVWEAAIKVGIGKLRVPGDLVEAVRQVGFHFLEISPEAAWKAGQLPWHHRDPFDRMLVAQAQHHGLPLMTDDPQFTRYGLDLVMP